MSETEVRMIEKKLPSIILYHSNFNLPRPFVFLRARQMSEFLLRMSEFIAEPPVLESVSEFPHRMSPAVMESQKGDKKCTSEPSRAPRAPRGRSLCLGCPGMVRIVFGDTQICQVTHCYLIILRYYSYGQRPVPTVKNIKYTTSAANRRLQ